LQQQQYNASAYNTAGQDTANLQNTDWLAQLQGQLGLQGTGLSTAGSLAGDQANQQVPLQPSLFSSIMQPLAEGAQAYASGGGSLFGGGGGGGDSGAISGTP
jgi:hypothetical protein